MNIRRNFFKIVSLVMIFAVLQGVLTSCGTADKTESKAESKNNTETVSLKDDFYTAVNYDWLQSADILKTD